MAAVLAIGASLISGVVGAVGAKNQADAAAAASEYNAKVDERNRTIVLNQTSVEQDDKRRENRRNLASIRAAYGASGFEMAGSPLDLLEDTALEQELDVQRIGYDGQLKAIGLTESANRSRTEGANAKKAGKIGAATALIGGVTQAAQMYGSATKGGASLL